ncbi:transposase [Streptomyces tibetensis]|uniref:Transposase n=1 Tax=Streptomyces tibetensis TaxID=2382123 RepID=A0ABW6N998_9ACTN
MGDAAGRHDLTDEAWEVVGPLLPVAACGRPARNLRRQVDGIRHRVRAGCPWRDVPSRYGPWSSLYRVFRGHQREGVWDHVPVADVARAAGVGTGTVGRHFETKTELVQAALADPIVEVIARADRADRLEPMAALHEVFHSMVEAAAAHRGLGDALAGLGGWEVTGDRCGRCHETADQRRVSAAGVASGWRSASAPALRVPNLRVPCVPENATESPP